MSKKKLWQVIGKESTQHHLASREQEDYSESVDLAAGREGVGREGVGAGGGGEGSACAGREGELSIEIESCESQKVRSSPSQPSNHDIAWCSSKFFIEKAFRKRIRTMAEQVRVLRVDLVAVRGALASGRESQASEMSALLNKFYNQFSKGQESRAMTTCQRCEHSKALIDQLTRQCWELEAKAKGGVEKGREEPPMKRIENSLLQERAEAIRRLKAEVEELREENETLYGQLGAVQQRAREMESQYKTSLLTFKGEIEAINEACCRKIEQIIHEKATSESELRLLQEKYLDLQTACEQDHQFKRTSQRKFFTQFPEDFSSPLPSPTSAQLHTAFAKHPPPKTTEISLTRRVAPRNTASLMDLDLSHWDSPTLYKGLPSLSRTYLDSTPQSRKSRNTSESSFGSALQKLAEIQKDVRKQINRSKKSFK